MTESDSIPRPSRRRRLLAVLLGLLLTPLLIEGAMQVASLFIQSDRELTDGQALVVCQGDSHTYGLWLPPDGAYPAQLEALLAERELPLAKVVNRGIPGKTTWQIEEELAEDLERWQPRVVCLWGGVNDRTGTRPEGDTPSWWHELRTVRLARNLADRISPQTRKEPQPELPLAPVGDERETFDVSGSAVTRTGDKERRLDFEGRDGEMQHLLLHGGNPEVEQYTRWIEEDLVRAARLAQSRGAVPILLTYPVDDFPRLDINRAIERAASQSGARLLDLRPHFEAAAQVHGWKPLLYGRGHPKKLGYSIIARLVAGALVEEQLIDGPAPDPLGDVRSWRPSELRIEPWEEEGAIVGIEVQYAPGHRVQMLLSDAVSEQGLEVTQGGSVRVLADVGEHMEKELQSVPLADGELFRNALRRTRRYMITLDGEGQGRIRLHPELDSVTVLHAVACALTPREGISRVSEPLRLR